MRRTVCWLCCLMTVAVARGGDNGRAGPGDLVPEPRRMWEVSAETMQTIGVDDSRNNYLMTQFFSFALEPFRPLVLGPVTVRGQLVNSLVVSAIVEGPDSYYIGWAPELRFILPLGRSPWSWQTAVAAGLGVADANQSRPDDRGLGQPLTFLLAVKAGLRYAVSDTWSVWAGGAWLHLSNGGLSEPRKENIGADSFGPVLGVSWSF